MLHIQSKTVFPGNDNTPALFVCRAYSWERMGKQVNINRTAETSFSGPRTQIQFLHEEQYGIVVLQHQYDPHWNIILIGPKIKTGETLFHSNQKVFVVGVKDKSLVSVYRIESEKIRCEYFFYSTSQFGKNHTEFEICNYIDGSKNDNHKEDACTSKSMSRRFAGF